MASNYFKQSGPCFNAVGACNPPAPRRKGSKVRGGKGSTVAQALGDMLEYAFSPSTALSVPPVRRGMGATATEYAPIGTRPVRGMLGADEIDFEEPEPTVDCAKNPSDIVCQVIHDPTTGGPSADPQTAYTACLKGGGSFASCNQIPGVTPEMILAAKSSNIVGSSVPLISTIPKTALFVGAAGLALYLLTR